MDKFLGNKAKEENPFSKIKFYNFVNTHDIKKDIDLINLTLSESGEDIYKAYELRLKKRKHILKKYLNYIKQNPEKNSYPKFLATYSYDIRHNPEYNDLLNVDEKLEKLNNEELNSEYSDYLSRDIEEVNFENEE
jgi:hypothetical protein